MNAINKISGSDRYARCVETSKRVRWDIDKDVIRGRRFHVAHKFLPDGLSLPDAFTSLSADEKWFVCQIHEAVMATSPNFHNVSRPVDLKPSLVVE